MRLRVLILSLLIGGYATGAADNETPPHAVNSPQDATRLATQVLGEQFLSSDLDELTKQARVVNLIDSTTPFLSTFAGSSRVWRVPIDDVAVSKDPIDIVPREQFRNFEVFIDSLSGRLIKIESFHGDQNELARHVLTAEQAEGQIRGGGHGDVYGTPATERPATSFVEALLACRPSPLEAKHILGQYVEYQYHFFVDSPSKDTISEPLPAWIISLAGVPPINARGGDISFMPVYTRNRIRLIVNDRTGRLKISSTVPSIPLTPEDK